MRPKKSRPTINQRVEAIEADMGLVKDEQHKQSVAIAELKASQDANSDKLDLIINLQTARMAARAKVITALLTAIGTVIGAIIGTACT